MSPKKRNQKLLGYTRVSRMREEGISPELQRKAIESYALAHGHEIQWLEPDLDESGKSLERPAMKHALELLERGEADGIIAARLDRLTRRVADLGKLLEDARKQDWNLIAIDLGVDLTTSNGKMVANLLGTVAEWELDRRRESWKEARSHAVARGVHISATIPAGYSRDEDRRLVPNEDAPAVVAAFEARARGESYSQIAKSLTKERVATSHYRQGRSGREHLLKAGAKRGLEGETLEDWVQAKESAKPVWSAQGAMKLLTNPVYTGVARSGEFVQKDAHEALVGPGLWTRVQARTAAKGDFVNPDRERSLLAGLIRCASCQRVMTADSTRRGDKIYPIYRCKGEGRCFSKASIGQHIVEEYVLAYVAKNAVLPVARGGKGESPEYKAGLARVDKAQQELDDFTAAWQEQGLSATVAAQMAAGLERDLNEAVEAVNSLPAPVSPESVWTELQAAVERTAERTGDDVESSAVIDRAKELQEQALEKGVSGALLAATLALVPTKSQRTILNQAVQSVNVRRGRVPAAERVTVVLRPDARAA